ncbi:unnamed protein product [Onchocerca ochengi]|uniref:Uncharacterized protein n=1 Tax=Onchocerca ochengi TaxID=42157 RepID=A0A182DWS4_ONCOC|nr:unnamed protein product [Onchocerca ochengi]
MDATMVWHKVKEDVIWLCSLPAIFAMSTTAIFATTTKEIKPEEPPVYTDLSQQFVSFQESDESATPPVTVEENEPDKQSRNSNDEAGKRSSNSDCNPNVTGCKTQETLEEFKMVDEKQRANVKKTKQFRKRNTRQGGGNGLCPPHPPEDVPVVNWTEAKEIKHIFPKTYNYVVYAQARYSSQYLNLSKWRKEFDFFFDKYKYWCDFIQKKQFGNHKEITKAKQLVGQLRWLLDHCWEGDGSKPLVPEMLWRARKEEARRCEQLLIRKEYYKREVLGKSAASSLSRRVNANIQKTLEGVELPKASLSNKIKKEEKEQDDNPSNFWKERDQIIKKRAHLFSLQFLVRRWADVLKQLQTPSGLMRPQFYCTVMRNHLEKYVQDLVAAYEKIKDSEDFDDQMIRVLLRRDVLLKQEMHNNGLESLTNNWVIFESKSPKVFKKKLDREVNSREREMSSREPSESSERFSSSNTSPILLKVRDYLDDDVKSTAAATPNSRAKQVAYNLSEVTNTVEIAATKDSEASISERSGLTTETEIPRPVAIKLSNLTECERNRLELQEVVTVEALWAAFAKTEAPKCKNSFLLSDICKIFLQKSVKDDKPILDAIEAVLNSCRNYRAVLEVPLPKTLADLRRNLKFRNIHEAVALLQTLIIQRHEAKIGRRVDPILFANPEIKRLQAQFAASAAVHNLNSAVSVKSAEVDSQILTSVGVKFSQNDIKQELDELPPKKKQKQLDKEEVQYDKDELEKETKSEKNDGGIEMLATNRPKRHIKVPQRFIFDDEKKEEEKKKKTVMHLQTKTAKRNSSKSIDKLKEISQQSSSRKEKLEKRTDSIASSMELSNMETIVVIPEDDGVNLNDRNCWSSNNDDEILMDPDLVDVTTEHELKCEPNGIVHDVFRYIATWKNGISKEVSRRVYELWTNRKIAEASEQATTEESKNKGTEKTAEQQRPVLPEIVQQKQISSINLLTHLDDTRSSNERVKNHNISSVYSNDSINRLSTTGLCTSGNIMSGDISGEQNEDGDCGPWRQVAFRKEASLSGPTKMDKLKTQYDHLLMISEKGYVGKLYSEWMYVPEGGPFDDRVKNIRQFIQELENILNEPNSTWRDYFNMKKYLQILIDNVMVDISALSGQAASTHLSSSITFSSSRSTVSDVGRDSADISIRPNSN